MYYEDHIRKLLIDSCHSSVEAQQFFRSRLDDSKMLLLLLRIAKDDEDYGGDAPMQAAYYLSQFSASMLVPHAHELLAKLPVTDGFASHIAVALGKTQLPEVRQALLEGLGDASGPDAIYYQMALEEYDKQHLA